MIGTCRQIWGPDDSPEGGWRCSLVDGVLLQRGRSLGFHAQHNVSLGGDAHLGSKEMQNPRSSQLHSKGYTGYRRPCLKTKRSPAETVSDVGRKTTGGREGPTSDTKMIDD